MELDKIEVAANSKRSKYNSIVKQLYLIKSELLSLRLSWKWALIIVLVTPLSTLYFLTLIFKGDKEYLTYVITGNMVMSLVTGTMLTLGQELGVLKQLKGFDYYAVLPLKKINLIIAYITRATIVTVPSMILIYFIGKIIIGIDMVVHPSIILVIIFSGFSLSSLGAAIGIYSRDADQASVITQVVQPLIIYLVPVFIPMENMPRLVNYISYIIPTRYVAQALRASYTGKFDLPSISMLAIFSIISIFLIEFKMDWRRG